MDEYFEGRSTLAEFARNLALKRVTMNQKGSVEMRKRIGLTHVMDLPEGIKPIAMKPHVNQWGEHVIYLMDESGKIYLIDTENKQLVRAIAPIGLFDD